MLSKYLERCSEMFDWPSSIVILKSLLQNVSLDGATELLNGNGKCDMDSLGFGFNINVESDKIKDTSLIQEFERIQKDTTDYCDIQVTYIF